jgi:hypothetical protein
MDGGFSIMSEHIIKAVFNTNGAIKMGASPTAPTTGLLGKKQESPTTQNNIAAYVSQSRKMREQHGNG